MEIDAQIRSELALVTWDVARRSNLNRLKGNLISNGELDSKFPGWDEWFDRTFHLIQQWMPPGIGTWLGHLESCQVIQSIWIGWMVNGVFNGETVIYL